ncbi:MAG: hypothetical protein DKINENOH_00950 [bacterium]|nr:hypothetical protein [bacterium]
MQSSRAFSCAAIVVSTLLSAFLVMNCGEAPTPGPISPSEVVIKSEHTQPAAVSPATGGRWLVPRRTSSSGATLAKSGYNPEFVQHSLQDVIDEMQQIVTNNPGSAVADKLEDAVAKARSALSELQKSPPDDAAALGSLAGARNDLNAAIKDRLLSKYHGGQFDAELQKVEEAVRTGSHAYHDCRGTSKRLWVKRSWGGLVAHCGHKIIVPKGNALWQDHDMSITISATDYIQVDFGPDGEFNQPVTIVLSYKDADLTGTDEQKLTIVWWDEKRGQWVEVGGVVNTATQSISAQVWHFTQYALSSR